MNIEGVILSELRRIPDERGCILHMLRADSSQFQGFGEIYFSKAYPGIIKGWHEHTRQVQNYAVIQGMIKLVLFDNRAESITYQLLQEFYIGEENYALITIPTGVINGYKCISTHSCIIANCSTLPHEPGEMTRYDPFGDYVPYKWDVVMK